jgi:undecaprenol kinase
VAVLNRFSESFVHAFDGIVEGTRTQPNLRVHLIATVIALLLALVLHLVLWAFVVIVLLIVLVVGLELVNTAIEAQVDLASPEQNPLAKRAKDSAAGAVLVVSIGAAIAGLAIFVEGALAGYVPARVPVLNAQTAAATLAATGVLTVLAKARFGPSFSGRATWLWAGLTLMYVAPVAPRVLWYWPEGIVAGMASYIAYTRRKPSSRWIHDATAIAAGVLLGVGTACLCLLAHDPRML